MKSERGEDPAEPAVEELWSAFERVVELRRSVRSFSNQPVQPRAIERLVRAACLAPSSANAQPWHYYIVSDHKTRKRLVATTYPGPDCRSKKTQAWIAQAPVIIVVCLEWTRGAAKYNFESRYLSGLQDVSATVQTILLGAAAMGLGACWVGGFRFLEVAEILGIPPTQEPQAMIPVGYPDRPPGDRVTRPLEDIRTWVSGSESDRCDRGRPT